VAHRTQYPAPLHSILFPSCPVHAHGRDAHGDWAASRAAASVDGLVHEAVAMLEQKEKADRVAEARSAKRLASSVYPFKPTMGVRTPKGPYLGTKEVGCWCLGSDPAGAGLGWGWGCAAGVSTREVDGVARGIEWGGRGGVGVSDVRW
jgi:hypothetical protein